MSSIKKDKNILEFWIDGKSAPYKFDINTGILYGLRGLAVRTTPAGIAGLIDRNTHTSPICSYMYSKHNDGCSYANMSRLAKELQFVDRLYSIGYFITYWDKRNLSNLMELLDSSNFKKFSAYYKEHPVSSALRDFYANHYADMWKAEHKLVANEHLTNEMIDWLFNHRSDFNKEQIALVAYYLSRGMWDFVRDVYDLNGYFTNFFEWCTIIGHTPDKSDFFRQYIAVKRTYIRNKTEYDNARFLLQQNKHRKALTYENEHFVVIVAETPQDLINEGQAQNNCVGGYNNSVIGGRCNIVFIRKKDNINQSYITCEIYADSGHIGQYLASRNNYVYDELALAFKKEYQEHLSKNWNVGE